MEQTLGKRIIFHRKRLGLTQDQLAEKLGVTAQAVSKWENDQSCPDISTLPRLAGIFGVSTDELLGCEDSHVVHQGEVIDGAEASDDDAGMNLDFHWEHGRKAALLFALWVLTMGGLLLAANILKWDVSFWDTLWPTALLYMGISGFLRKFSFFSLGCTLFGSYFLLYNLQVLPFSLGWELTLPIILVLLGVSLLVDAMRRPKKPAFHIFHNGSRAHANHAPINNSARSYCTTEGETFNCVLSFSDQDYLIELERLSHGSVSTSFGDCDVDLSGVKSVSDSCTIDANCSFGDLKILVPRRYAVKPNSTSAFASVEVKGQPDSDPAGTIYIDAQASFGEISIRYI